MQEQTWQPPVRFFIAGRQSVSSEQYRCDCKTHGSKVNRLLIKYTISGTGVLYAGRERIELPAGWVFMLNRPGDYVYCYEGNGEPWEFEYVSLLMPEGVNWLPNEMLQAPAWDCSDNPELLRQMRKLVTKVTSAQTMPYSVLEKSAIQDSADAYRLYLSCIASYTNSSPAHNAAHKLREYLQENYLNELQLGRICRDMNYTPEALCRQFKQTFNTPPMQYIISLRLEKARQLLQESDLSLEEIAARCSLSSANYLCRIFRQRFGITPGKYRKNPDPLLGMI